MRMLWQDAATPVKKLVFQNYGTRNLSLVRKDKRETALFVSRFEWLLFRDGELAAGRGEKGHRSQRRIHGGIKRDDVDQGTVEVYGAFGEKDARDAGLARAKQAGHQEREQDRPKSRKRPPRLGGRRIEVDD